MNRKQFISLLTVGAATTAVSASLVSCAKANDTMVPTNIDFTIDINTSAYSVLKTNGGSVYKNNIIIARTSAGAFLAYSQYCTHAGCTVNFDGMSHFECFCHGSVFDANGNVVQGPAFSALQKYNTQLAGTMLRVFS